MSDEIRKQTAAELAEHARGLALELLPGAVIGRGFCSAADYAGGPGLGLIVTVSGKNAGQWRRFGVGVDPDWRDLVSLIKRVNNCSRAEAVTWGRAWLGYSLKTGRKHNKRQLIDGRLPMRAKSRCESDREIASKRRAGGQLYRQSVPASGTPGEAWLRALGFAGAELPADFKFDPFVPHPSTPSGGLPAILAAVRGPSGSVLAFWRHWFCIGGRAGMALRRDVLKAGAEVSVFAMTPTDSAPQAMAIGAFTGAGVYVQGQPSLMSTAHVFKSVRDALSFRAPPDGEGVVAVLSASNMAHLIAPAASRIILYASPGDQAVVSAAAAVQREVAEAIGRAISIEVRDCPPSKAPPPIAPPGVDPFSFGDGK